MNILLGSVLASIGLTIPLVTPRCRSPPAGNSSSASIQSWKRVMLLLSLATATLTFSLPRTNVLLGCVHLLLFGMYLLLMFD